MRKRLQSITRENLSRDQRVLGKAWNQTYKHYFGNPENIQSFVRQILSRVPKRRKLAILYPASGSGALGEALRNALKKKRVEASLTLVDASARQLDENKNSSTKKILQDLLAPRLNGRFDVAIMRSSLDYFPTERLQANVLSMVRKHLAKGGVFFNQAASMPTLTERNLADQIYDSTTKIGRRHFQCPQDIRPIYEKAGFVKFKKIGSAPKLIVTEKEHQERYGVTAKEIGRIRKMIGRVPEKKRPNVKTTQKGYRLKFQFPIYAGWKG